GGHPAAHRAGSGRGARAGSSSTAAARAGSAARVPAGSAVGSRSVGPAPSEVVATAAGRPRRPAHRVRARRRDRRRGRPLHRSPDGTGTLALRAGLPPPADRAAGAGGTAPDAAQPYRFLTGRKRNRRRLLLTTNTLDRAIAAAASSGATRPATARGTAATL